jgi:hypothetical protein
LEGTNCFHVSGTATNNSPSKVKNVTVSGVLTDASRQIVSLGSSYGLQDDIPSGGSVRLELRVKKEPSVDYRLYAQAERDWEQSRTPEVSGSRPWTMAFRCDL